MNSIKHIRTALVTGGGSGLGREFCLYLARAGYRVAVSDIDLASAEATAALANKRPGSSVAIALDVTDPQAWHDVAARLRSMWPRLDLLVNNAGICATGEIGAGSLEPFERVMQVNFYGVLHGCHTLVPWLKETAPGGHVVNIASITGVVAPPTLGAYNASKAAVIALSETLYGELKPHGVGVTVAAPGFFPTKLLEHGMFAEPLHRTQAERLTRNSRYTVGDVVARTMAAVARRELYAIEGRKARWYWRAKRLLPTQLLNHISAGYQRMLRNGSKIT